MNQQILKINGQYIKFHVTTNNTLPAILKNSGSMVVHHDVNTAYNSIWLGGELIAGGWGFVKSVHDALEFIAKDYEPHIKKIEKIEKDDVSKLHDLILEIIGGVDHDKWNLNNYLQKSGEYANASDTYIITSLADLGGASNVRIKLSQLPLLLRKAEYKNIEFSDIHYGVTFKYGLNAEEQTVYSTTGNIELPVNASIVSVNISFFAQFNDSSGIDELTVGISKYKASWISGLKPEPYVQYEDTSFSQVFESGTFTKIESGDIVTDSQMSNENWQQLMYNFDNSTNKIYYSNFASKENKIYYQIKINYGESDNAAGTGAVYSVLEGDQKLIDIHALVKPTDEKNLKITAVDEEGNPLYDTINKIQLHDELVCQLNVHGYNMAYFVTDTVNGDYDIFSSLNAQLYKACKCKVGEQMDFIFKPEQYDYLFLVLPAEYKLKGIYRLVEGPQIDMKNMPISQEYNYTGYFAEVKPGNTTLNEIFVTDNPYKYKNSNVPFYQCLKSRVYIANITNKVNSFVHFRVYTEYDEAYKSRKTYATYMSEYATEYNRLNNNIDELFTIPDENFNETHWLNVNESFEHDWENLNNFLSILSDGDNT